MKAITTALLPVISSVILKELNGRDRLFKCDRRSWRRNWVFFGKTDELWCTVTFRSSSFCFQARFFSSAGDKTTRFPVTSFAQQKLVLGGRVFAAAGTKKKIKAVSEASRGLDYSGCAPEEDGRSCGERVCSQSSEGPFLQKTGGTGRGLTTPPSDGTSTRSRLEQKIKARQTTLMLLPSRDKVGQLGRCFGAL